MRPIVVLILQPPPSAPPGSARSGLESARAAMSDAHRVAFQDVGVAEVRSVSNGPPPARSFGERLRAVVADVIASNAGRQTGLIVLGGGSMPLARHEDYEAFVATAGGRATRALANSYYSADAIAVPDAGLFLDVPDLPSDNALPRWLAERAGVPVADLRDRPRLSMDLDSPLDVVLVALDRGCPPALARIAGAIAKQNPAAVAAIAGVRRVMDERRAELLIAGRTSSQAIAWLEQHTACRVRALVEERGLRAGSPLALGPADTDLDPPGEPDRVRERVNVQLRPPRSVLGMLLDDRGPEALANIVGELADAAIVDTRVLLAHRLGADEAAWPSADDRIASDLLRAHDIADPWLRDLTASAAASRAPILLGGHSVVGPGIPLLGAEPR